jgi:predicted RND superfamily exporter protein
LTAQRNPKQQDDHMQNTVSYDNGMIEQISKVITTVIGALLPVIAIVVLYYINDMKKRLGLLVLFTAVFSLSLTLATKAKVTEIFGATSA